MTLDEYRRRVAVLRQDFHDDLLEIMAEAKADGHRIEAVMAEGAPPPPKMEFDL